MDLEDINLQNFTEKVTYSSNPTPEGKLVISNGVFVQCLLQLKLISKLDKLGRNK